MKQRESQLNHLFIKSSKFRRALLYYILYSLAAFFVLLSTNKLDSFLLSLLGAAIGVGLVALPGPDTIFSISAEKVIGPTFFGRRLIEIPLNQLDLNRLLEQSIWDKVQGIRKIRSVSGKSIYISIMDFNARQRADILRSLEKLGQDSR